MGSASREALAKAQLKLSGLGSKVNASVAGELLSAAAALGNSAALRSALADNVVDAKIKQKLVKDLFAQASAPTRALLDDIASHRWSSSEDVTDALENLGIRATAIVEKGSLDEKLLAINALIASNHELELTLGSKLGDSAAKGDLIEKLLKSQASAGAIQIVSHLVRNANGRRIGAMLNHAASIVADQRGFTLADVTVAAPLNKATTVRLEKSLTKIYDRAVKINFSIDPAILGGMRIQIGDDVIDGSVATRLKELKLQLAS